MKYMTTYLLAFDEQHDKQASELRKCIHRAKEAEICTRKLHVQFAEEQAQAAAIERTTITEALKTTKDRHAKQLRTSYLITRSKRRMLTTDEQEPLILEGIPVYPLERRRLDLEAPPAPPPTEVSEIEHLIPLTQPLPRKEEGP
jgi:type IV secretory pathway VirB10-like protein